MQMTPWTYWFRGAAVCRCLGNLGVARRSGNGRTRSLGGTLLSILNVFFALALVLFMVGILFSPVSFLSFQKCDLTSCDFDPRDLMNLVQKVEILSMPRLAKNSVEEASNQTHAFAWLVVQNYSGSCYPRWQLDAVQLAHPQMILRFEAKEENFLNPPQGQEFPLGDISSISAKSVAKIYIQRGRR